MHTPTLPAPRLLAIVVIAAAVAGSLPAAQAQDSAPKRSGKLLLTSGVSQVEGSGGGGLTPWALIGGYGTRD